MAKKSTGMRFMEDMSSDTTISVPETEFVNEEKPTNEIEENYLEESVKEIEEDISEELDTILKGVVSNCSALRIRQAPSLKAKEIGRINAGTFVKIIKEESTQNFYAVSLDGIEGFCIKQYITLI